MKVKIKPLNEEYNADMLPRYMSELAAGADLYNHEETTVELCPGDIYVFSVGFAMELPPGYEAQIRPRSGLSLKHGVTVVNAPGTIDADYRGPVKVGLVNVSNKSFFVEPGMRIAQMVISKHEQPEFDVVADLSDTARGEGGFGSTGL